MKSLLLRWYGWLLRFYPPTFRDKFADEMRTVLSEAIAEAESRGGHAVVALLLREAYDFPKSILSAYLQEERELTMQPPTETEKRMHWLGVLVGILPFIFLGPVQAMVSYASDFRTSFNIGNDQTMFQFWLLMGVGTLLGLVRQCPRWSFPYIVMFVFVPLVNGIAKLTMLLPQERLAVGSHLVLLFVFFVILTVPVVLIARWLKLFRHLYQSIRQDWTRLSFGLFGYVAFATGFYGGDHPPPFGITVLLPSAIVVVGALAHLLSINRRQRILSLVLAIALLSIAIPGGEQVPPWVAFLFLLAVVFLPAALELLPRGKKTVAA